MKRKTQQGKATDCKVSAAAAEGDAKAEIGARASLGR